MKRKDQINTVLRTFASVLALSLVFACQPVFAFVGLGGDCDRTEQEWISWLGALGEDPDSRILLYSLGQDLPLLLEVVDCNVLEPGTGTVYDCDGNELCTFLLDEGFQCEMLPEFSEEPVLMGIPYSCPSSAYETICSGAPAATVTSNQIATLSEPPSNGQLLDPIGFPSFEYYLADEGFFGFDTVTYLVPDEEGSGELELEFVFEVIDCNCTQPAPNPANFVEDSAVILTEFVHEGKYYYRRANCADTENWFIFDCWGNLICSNSCCAGVSCDFFDFTNVSEETVIYNLCTSIIDVETCYGQEVEISTEYPVYDIALGVEGTILSEVPLVYLPPTGLIGNVNFGSSLLGVTSYGVEYFIELFVNVEVTVCCLEEGETWEDWLLGVEETNALVFAYPTAPDQPLVFEVAECGVNGPGTGILYECNGFEICAFENPQNGALLCADINIFADDLQQNWVSVYTGCITTDERTVCDGSPAELNPGWALDEQISVEPVNGIVIPGFDDPPISDYYLPNEGFVGTDQVTYTSSAGNQILAYHYYNIIVEECDCSTPPVAQDLFTDLNLLPSAHALLGFIYEGEYYYQIADCDNPTDWQIYDCNANLICNRQEFFGAGLSCDYFDFTDAPALFEVTSNCGQFDLQTICNNSTAELYPIGSLDQPVGLPENGTLDETGFPIIYTPNTGFIGTEFFGFDYFGETSNGGTFFYPMNFQIIVEDCDDCNSPTVIENIISQFGSGNSIKQWLMNAVDNSIANLLIPSSGFLTETACSGEIYDSGGPGQNYDLSAEGILTLDPSGASAVTIDFFSFNYESEFDTLFIYDGLDINAPLIGAFTGDNLPNGGSITSTNSNGALTLRETSNQFVSLVGFEASFTCNANSSEYVYEVTSCPGENFYRQIYSCQGNLICDFSADGIVPHCPDIGFPAEASSPELIHTGCWDDCTASVAADIIAVLGFAGSSSTVNVVEYLFLNEYYYLIQECGLETTESWRLINCQGFDVCAYSENNEWGLPLCSSMNLPIGPSGTTVYATCSEGGSTNACSGEVFNYSLDFIEGEVLSINDPDGIFTLDVSGAFPAITSPVSILADSYTITIDIDYGFNNPLQVPYSGTYLLQVFIEACSDCAGVVGGSFQTDLCGYCLDPSDPEFNACLTTRDESVCNNTSIDLFYPSAISGPNSPFLISEMPLHGVAELIMLDNGGYQLNYDPSDNYVGTDLIVLTQYSFLPGIEWVEVIYLDVYDCGIFDVYPGDINYDGIADNYDVLYFGIGFGDMGSARENASTDWLPQAAEDWGLTLPNGIDEKHSDCDGNGEIELIDKDVILQNYGLEHTIGKGSQGDENDPPLYVEMPSSVEPGQLVEVPIIIGSDLISVQELYGVAFSIEYDPAFVEEGTLSVSFMNSVLGVEDVEQTGLHKTLQDIGRADIGITRLNKMNWSGTGEIGILSYVMADDIIGKQGVPFSMNIIDVFAMSLDGTELLMNAGSAETDVQSGLEELLAEIKVSPNPASQEISIDYSSMASELSNLTVRLIDLRGSTVMMEELNDATYGTTWDVSGLSNGLYFLEISSESAVYSMKIQVMH